MIFSTVEFLVFFVGFVLAGLVVCRLLLPFWCEKAFLLLASYLFYGMWDWRFCALIAVSTLIDYVLGQAIAAEGNLARRRWLLTLSIVANLSVLGFFKYFNFFVDQLLAVLPFATADEVLRVILPVGISFYTFQTMSYSIDVFHRRIPAERLLLNFALFVAFFPQLVAGPIVRASLFLPQLQTAPRVSIRAMHSALIVFSLGLFKKVMVADRLAEFVDITFDNPGLFDAATTWLSVLAFGVQIYADFSGYSDMAYGVALVMGYRLVRNFRLPYLAIDPSDFWRRWHVSLSSWLRDYLYIPLGGSRQGRLATTRNVIITMTLGGLWHGAAWRFVAWGLLHGALIVCGHQLGRLRLWPRRVGGWAVTVGAVFLIWVFFRATTFEGAVAIYGQLFVPGPGIAWPAPYPILIIAGLAAHHAVLASRWRRHAFVTRRNPLTPFILPFCWLLPMFFHPRAFQPFIYFQF
ncbi:MAG: MBOAT family O-acyltransferase [Alphaproteobacteria bacterium]